MRTRDTRGLIRVVFVHRASRLYLSVVSILAMSEEDDVEVMASESYFDELLDCCEFGDRAYYADLRAADKEREQMEAAKREKDNKISRKQKKDKLEEDLDDEERKYRNKRLAQTYMEKVNTAQYRNDNIEMLCKKSVTAKKSDSNAGETLNIHAAPFQSLNRLETIEKLYGNKVNLENKKIVSKTIDTKEAMEMEKPSEEKQPTKIKKNRKKNNALLNALQRNIASTIASTDKTENEMNDLTDIEVDLVDKFKSLLPSKSDENTESGSSTSTVFDMESKKKNKPKKKTSQRRRMFLDELPPPPEKPYSYVPCCLNEDPPDLASSSNFPSLS